VGRRQLRRQLRGLPVSVGAADGVGARLGGSPVAGTITCSWWALTCQNRRSGAPSRQRSAKLAGSPLRGIQRVLRLRTASASARHASSADPCTVTVVALPVSPMSTV
jgi:hypothetical protein